MAKIRYGVIGIKGIGRYHCRSVRENPRLELAALCDCDEAFVERRATELGTRAFTDFRAMLAANAVDAVSIAVPHYLLAPIALECLQAGVHVFVEKPFAIRLSQADALIETARRKNLKLCAGFQYRTFDTPQIIKRVLESGEIGKVQRILWTWHSFRPATYLELHPWHKAWKSAGGGVLMYHAAHDIDLMCWLFGKPVEVSAMMGCHLHDAQVEDIAGATIRFENGALAVLQATTNHVKAFNVRQIAGDKGLLVLPDAQSLTENEAEEILLGVYPRSTAQLLGELQGYSEQPPVAWRRLRHRPGPRAALLQRKIKGLAYRLRLMKRPPLNRVGLRAMIEQFAVAIETGAEPLVSGESARTTVELINAMNLSAMHGRTVSLPLDATEYDELFEQLSSGQLTVPRSC